MNNHADTMNALSMAWQGVVQIFLHTPEIILPAVGLAIVIGVCSGLYYRRKFRRR